MSYVTFPPLGPSSNIDFLAYVRDAATGVTLYTFEHGEYDLDLGFSRASQSYGLTGADAPYDPFGAGGFPLDKRAATLTWLKRYRTGETHSTNRINFHRAIADGRQVQLVLLDSDGVEWIYLAKATNVPYHVTAEATFRMEMGITFELNPPYARRLYPAGWFYWDLAGVYWDDQSTQVASVTVNTPGNYSVAPTGVTFSGGGSGAAGTAAVSGGQVTGVTMTNAGSNYIGTALVAFTGGGGSGATGIARMAGTAQIGPYTVAGVTITNPGTGYATPPTVTFLDPVKATGTPVISGSGPYTVTGVTVTNPGSGYLSPPTVSFTGGTGTQATATAVLGTPADGFTWDTNALPSLALTAASQTLSVTNAGDAPDRSGVLTINGPWVPFDLQLFDERGALRHWLTWFATLAAGDILRIENSTGRVTLNGNAAFDNRFLHRGDDYAAIWPGTNTIYVFGYTASFNPTVANGKLTVDSRDARY